MSDAIGWLLSALLGFVVIQQVIPERPRKPEGEVFVRRSCLILCSAASVVALAFAGVARAEDSTDGWSWSDGAAAADTSSSTGDSAATATEPSPDGWSWDGTEAAPAPEPAPAPAAGTDGWSWGEADAAAPTG